MRAILGLLLVAALGCAPVGGRLPVTDDPAPPLTGYFVAPDGNDTGPGTEYAPFATIQRAIDAMRGSTEKQTYVRAGVYLQRGQTIALDERDHGVAILAYPGETPVVSGGFAITGWTQVDAARDIWAAALPAELTSVGAVTVDGGWFDIARTPDRDPADSQAHASWFFVEQSLGPPVENPWDPSFGKDDAFTYRGNDLAAALAINDEPDAWISVWDKFGWSADILKIDSIDHGSRTVQLAAASQFGLAPNSRYFVYGLRTALDAPGEYYVDHATHQLLVIPRAGVDPNGAVIIAAPYNGPPIIAIDGANDVRVSGLELRDQHNTGRWGVEPGGAVKIVAGSNAWIDHNTMHAVGLGVDIEAGDDHLVEANAIYDVACSGIALFGNRSELSGNTIRGVGLVEQRSHGVLVGPGRNVIAHNYIAETPHYAIIAVGDQADGLVIEYNVIERANLGANDAGAIYLKNRGNYNPAARETVRYNKLVGSGGLAVGDDTSFSAPGFSFAIYLDDGQSGTDVYGNLIIGASFGAVFPHNGTDNHIFNNVVIAGVHSQLFIESANNPAGNVFEQNIFASTARTPTIIVKYAGQEETFRDNLFFNPAEPAYFDAHFFEYGDGRTLTVAEAAAAGFHTGSVIADPLFVDAAAGDYRLRPGSPAFALGFQELPYGAMGP